MMFTPAEINAAQLELNRHPDNSPFWDSPSGQDVMDIAKECGLKATNTDAERRAQYRDYFLQFGEDAANAVRENMIDRAHHLSV